MRNRNRRSLQSNINVTPFVDVMLVLLVVFIVTAPLITSQLDLSLPNSSSPVIHKKTDAVTISLDRHGTIFFEQTKTTLEELLKKLSHLHKNNPDIQLFLEAHRDLSYHNILHVLDKISRLGLSNVSLVTQTQNA